MKISHLLIQVISIFASFATSSGGSVCDVRDFWALVQLDYAQVPHSGVDAAVVPGAPEPKTRLVDDALSARQKWPEMGDVWDSLKDSMTGITRNVGDLTGNPSHRLVEGLYNRTMEGIAIYCAKSLNKVLLVIDKATDVLLQKTLQAKAELMKFLNNTPQVLPLFEWALEKSLRGSIYGWQVLRSVVDSSGHVIVSGFMAAGQEGLSSEFNVALDTSLQKIDDFIQAMANSTEDLEGIGKPMGSELHRRLRKLDQHFKGMLLHVPDFGVMFQQAFQIILDRIIDALPTTSPLLQMEFDSVLHNVTTIVWRMRSSSREFVLTCHSAVTLVAKQSHAELPSWQAIAPLDQSAGVRAGGVLMSTALVVVLAARL